MEHKAQRPDGGSRFNRLTLVAPTGRKNSSRSPIWIARCDCGNTTEVSLYKVVGGHLKSCGCLRKETAMTNGRLHKGQGRKVDARTYKSWESMRDRCNNKNNKSFAIYGGRGVSVCEAWESFDRFLRDMGPRPLGMTLDRIDASGDYEPNNCRWATAGTQARNRRSNRLLCFDGATKPLAEWAELHGLHPATLLYRINRGWDVNRAIETPASIKSKPKT